MKIAINARFAGQNTIEGYGRFTNGLAGAMIKACSADDFVMMYDRIPNTSSIHGSNVTNIVKGPAARHPILWKIWYDLSLPAMVRKAKADVLFSPDGFCSLNCPVPQVLAIHDLAFLHYPSGISSIYRSYYRHYTPKFIRKAKHIITVSEFSKQDILSHYPEAKGKIDVVYNAADSGFRPLDWKDKENVKQEYTGGAEYFCYTGAIHPRKNLVNLLKGFSWFKNRHRSGIKLVLAGRVAWGSEDFLKLMQTYKYREDVLTTGYLSENKLHRLVASAYAVVYPSAWEGFGLPVLEGMQAGVPVIASSSSSMPEVGGDAALYCDPGDPDAWGKAMGLLYKDEQYRSELIRKGLDRAAFFSWENSAKMLREILGHAAS